MKHLLTALLISLGTVCHAHDTGLHDHVDAFSIDRQIDKTIPLDFPDGSTLEPKRGSFELVSQVTLSNVSGTRRATVTIRNSSHFQRLFDKEHVVAIFADGHHRHPLEKNLKFKGNEERTFILDFGFYTYPILRLITRSD